MQRGLLLQLSCGISCNDWGKRGDQSLVRRLSLASRSGGSASQDDPDLPYAEIWMGVHPSLPSRVLDTGELLLEALRRNPCVECNGAVCNRSGGFPLLFKVLSIEKALSIQAHPTSEMAKMLHAQYRDIYPDESEKPEMIVALTECEALVGFRPATELYEIISSVAPFRSLLGEKPVEALRLVAEQSKNSGNSGRESEAAIRQAFESLLHMPSVMVETACDELLKVMESYHGAYEKELPNSVLEAIKLVLRASSEYPKDVGIFIILFMNYVKLAPGESLFIPVGEIHAYVSGDMVECMISSANILRAGFTRKFRDINNLLSLLNYCPQAPSRVTPRLDKPSQAPYVTGIGVPSCVRYDAPGGLFSVCLISVPDQDGKIDVDRVASPSILICVSGNGLIEAEGNGQKLAFGSVFFIGCGAKISIQNAGDEFLICYRAYSLGAGEQ